jgi:hypothetical protein
LICVGVVDIPLLIHEDGKNLRLRDSAVSDQNTRNGDEDFL